MKEYAVKPVLIVDEDVEDCGLIKEAMKEAGFHEPFFFLTSTKALLDYLRHSGDYKDRQIYPRPGLILLDSCAHRPDPEGLEILSLIKRDASLRHIPVVMMSDSHLFEFVSQAYDKGANSFVIKPLSYQKLVEMMKEMRHYWFEIVELPSERESVAPL